MGFTQQKIQTPTNGNPDHTGALKIVIKIVYIAVILLLILTISFFLLILIVTFFPCEEQSFKMYSYCDQEELRKSATIAFLPLIAIETLIVFLLRKLLGKFSKDSP